MTRSGKMFMYCFILLLSSDEMSLHALAQSITRQLESSEADAPTPDTTDTFVSAGDTRLHYVESGSGRTVVLIHGNAGDVQDFDFGTLDLLARKFHVIAFDLPGHGLS